MDLLKPVWKSEKVMRWHNGLMRAIEKRDKKTLYQYALEGRYSIRSEASSVLRIIDDEEKFFEIGMAKPELLDIVLERISDPTLLKRALESEAVSDHQRFEICKKLNNSAFTDSERESLDAAMEAAALKILLGPGWNYSTEHIAALRSEELLMRVVAEAPAGKAQHTAEKLSIDKYFEALLQRIANNGDGVEKLVTGSLVEQLSELQCWALLQAVDDHPQLKGQSAIAESLLSGIHKRDLLAALEAAGAADDATLTRLAALRKKYTKPVIAPHPHRARWEAEEAEETALYNEINSTESVQRLFELWDQKLADRPRECLQNRLKELAKGPNGAEICEEATRRIRIDSDMNYGEARKKYEKLQQIIYAGTNQDYTTTLLLAGGETLVNNSVKRLTGGRSEDSSVEGDINFLSSVYRFHPEYRAMFAPLTGKPVRMHEDFAGWYCVPNREARGDYEYVIDFEKP